MNQSPSICYQFNPKDLNLFGPKEITGLNKYVADSIVIKYVPYRVKLSEFASN